MFLGFWQEGQANVSPILFMFANCWLLASYPKKHKHSYNQTIPQKHLRQYWAWSTFLIPPGTQAYPADQLPFTSVAPISPSSLFHNYSAEHFFLFIILKFTLLLLYFSHQKNGYYIRSCALPLYKTYILLWQYMSFEYSILIIYHYAAHLCIQILFKYSSYISALCYT